MDQGVSNLPEWVRPLESLTRDDVIRSGACADGVRDWCKAKRISETLVPVERLGSNEYITRAARLSGSGYGYGYGSGSGDGYGDGDGYGSGSGSGDGYQCLGA